MASQVKTKKALLPKLRFPEFKNAGEWEVDALSNLIQVVTPPKKIPTTQYNKTGRFPVIDQSQSQVAGWTDDSEAVIDKEWPLVIFGDHTCILKMVEEPFAQGADGIKIFYGSSIINTAYLFQQMQANPLEMEEYKRHFSILKDRKVYYSRESGEQQRIADCLSSLDELIEAQAERLEALKRHKKGLMQQLFPGEGQTLPKLRFPEFRNKGEWEVKEVGEIFKVTRGEVLSMTLVNDKKAKMTPYPVYSSQTKNNGLSGYYSDYLYENAITWTTDGAGAGDVNYRAGKFYCTNVCGVLLSTEGYANPFVAAMLNSVSKKHVSYVGNPKLMNGVMSGIVIPLPHIPEQQRIADCLSSLDKLMEAEGQKLEALKRHKKGLMQQLFPVASEVEK